MIAVVFILSILAVALIWRNIVNEIRINDLRGDHNALTGKVKNCEALIDAQRLPDRDKVAMITAILDLRYPRKYPDGHIFINAEGERSCIVGTYITYDADCPFVKDSVRRHYYYVRTNIMEWPSKQRCVVSESYLTTTATVRAEALVERSKKKGGSKS